MVYFIVTGRCDGDDEDSCIVRRAATADEATNEMREFLAESRRRDGNAVVPQDQIYINIVVRCESDTEPEIIQFPYV